MGVEVFGMIAGLGFVLSFGYWCTDFLVIQRAMAAESMSARAPHAAHRRIPQNDHAVHRDRSRHRGACADQNERRLRRCRSRATAYDYDQVFTTLMAQFYPSGHARRRLTALMASFMSGMAGNVTAFNTVFTYDIYQSYIRTRHASDHHYLTVGRVTTVVGTLLSIGAAYLAQQLQQHHGSAAAGLRLRQRAAVRNIPAGHVLEAQHRPRRFLRLLAGTVAASLTHGLTVAEGKGGWIAPLSQLPVHYGAEFLDRHLRLQRLLCRHHPGQPGDQTAPPEELEGLVYGLTKLPEDSGVIWYRRPRR